MIQSVIMLSLIIGMCLINVLLLLYAMPNQSRGDAMMSTSYWFKKYTLLTIEFVFPLIIMWSTFAPSCCIKVLLNTRIWVRVLTPLAKHHIIMKKRDCHVKPDISNNNNEYIYYNTVLYACSPLAPQFNFVQIVPFWKPKQVWEYFLIIK